MNNKSSEYSHQEYVSLFQKGDERGIAFFYREFHAALSHYAYQWVQDQTIAGEIAAEALEKTWKMHWKLDSYGAIRAYLYKIVQRDSVAFINKEKRRAVLHQQSQVNEIDLDTPFEQLVRSEVYRLIHTALKELSPANRKVIIMHYLEGKSTGEIAKELNRHRSTINTQKTLALETLRKKLMRPALTVFYLFIKFFFPFL